MHALRRTLALMIPATLLAACGGPDSPPPAAEPAEVSSDFAASTNAPIAVTTMEMPLMSCCQVNGVRFHTRAELGFDDLLRDMDSAAFADQMAAHIEGAIAAAEAIDGTLVDALATDLPSVVALYEAIKLVTDDLKTMFLTILDLEAPNRAAGDND